MAQKMRAVRLFAPKDIRCVEVDVPHIEKDTQVLIKVKSCGVCGSDIPRVMVKGTYHFPTTIGHEFAGQIVDCGDKVKNNLTVGDRVSVMPLIPCGECQYCKVGQSHLCDHYDYYGSRRDGAMAEYVVVESANCLKLPDNVDYEEGSFTDPVSVGLHAVRKCRMEAGKTAAVFGLGAIGFICVQWLRALGCTKVIAVDVADDKLALAKRLGADEVINTKEDDYMEKAMAITGGKGYGFVFETAGQVPTMHMAFELAANKAHVCFIGTPHENLTFTPAQWENMNRKEFKLTGSWMSYSAPFPGREWDLTAHYFATGQLKFDPGFIYKKIPMSQAQEAFQLFKTPGLVKGKILLSNEEE